ncbi:MAG: acetylornithine deacetylase [Phenylobacterium sp.]|uniref:acetylornithine deacetylase n=1 Tax=Phenylobacterium sp. TaxID=1871053 RepID=UPI0017B8AE31|nr:acetylornithine deacetylase [Phenylobacterium sp.]MBA4793691.1 acetylornithine deacetylase [Phenylobacterium sp.]
MSSAQTLTPRALELLERLVAFDTTSRLSNLELISWVEAYLDGHGAPHRRVPNAEGTKSNLIATIGPDIPGGVVLSGHTDVVPVDGQPWTSDPFKVTPRDGRLYGRGTCDMKGFLALALAAVPDLLAAGPQKPVHLAFSYDEEVGCLGAPDMIKVIAAELPRPALVVVGEPTNMEAVSGHKGITTFKVTVNGHEAHSSQTQLGVSANMAAIRLMGRLCDLSEQLEREADPASPFTPKHATLTVGQVNGGTAVNILARECVFFFDLRAPPGVDPMAVLEPFFEDCRQMDAALKAQFPRAGVSVVRRSHTPPLAPEKDGAAEAFARRLAGDNGPARVVAFAAEAGQFQEAGFSTVICGPGSIDQAHQPDEFVEMSQMERGAAFMARLVDWAARGE